MDIYFSYFKKRGEKNYFFISVANNQKEKPYTLT